MACPAEDILIAFAANDLDEIERHDIGRHIQGCSDCLAELSAIESIRKIACACVLEDPPPWAVAKAATIPSEGRSSSLNGLIGRVANLLFDTFRDPLPQGARASVAQGRQMLYHVLDYDIDVRVLPSGATTLRVAGQVLPGPDRAIESASGLEVILSRPGSMTLKTTNELGEFSFEAVAEGEWTLQIEAAEDRLIVERLPVFRP